MKQIVCVYCEGTDTKFAVLEKTKKGVQLIKTASVDVYSTSAKGGAIAGTQIIDADAALQLDNLDQALGSTSGMTQGAPGEVFEGIVNSELGGLKLHNCEFISVMTEPSLYYQFSNKKQTGGGATQELLPGNTAEDKKSKQPKNGDSTAIVDLADGGKLKIHMRQDMNCISMINRLAKYNHKRFYKIISVKSAEVSLAHYAAKRKKFFPDDYSLVVYIGKEYSKLIFMHGRKIKHLGSTLDVGTTNLHTYDVYFSKILLEMENGGIPTLDNIIVCGEDVSENLILSFYGTFPETNVSRIDYDDLQLGELPDETRLKLSAFAVPIAAFFEHVEDLEKKQKGINLIPKYVLEDQKFFQFGWHALLALPLLFFTAFFLTQQILSNSREISRLDRDIAIQTELKNRNLELLSQIEALDIRISNFDQTQTILDTITVGTEIWGKLFGRISAVAQQRRNFWVRSFAVEQNTGLKLEGHSLNKFVLTDVTANLDSSLLKSINYDPIRDRDAYRYVITFPEPKR